MSATQDKSPPAETQPARRSWRRRLTRMLVLYVLTPYVAVCVIFFVLQRRFLYPATQVDSIHAADAGLSRAEARDVSLSTRDGLTLHGWFVTQTPAENADASADSLLIICFPGNSGNRLDRVVDCREFSRLGCDVLLFDYRGYGDNPGSPSEEDFAADARLVWAYATGELARNPERIVIFGESIGGAVAVRLAAELCDAGTPPAGLVLSSTFASLPETVRWHYPYFPFHWMLLDRWPSVERIGRVACPVLQLHGTRDDFVPIAQARRLFAAARDTSTSGIPPRFVELRGSGHNDLPVMPFRRELNDYLEIVRQHAGTRRSE